MTGNVFGYDFRTSTHTQISTQSRRGGRQLANNIWFLAYDINNIVYHQLHWNEQTAGNKTAIRTREIQVVSGKHFGRWAAVFAVDAVNWRRGNAARTLPSVSAGQVVDVQQAGRVNDRCLMPRLGLYHHVVLVLHDVIHWVPWTQTAAHTVTSKLM